MRRVWQRAAALLLAGALLAGLGGCAGNSGTPETGSGPKPEPLQIGMSFDSFVIERWTRDRDVFVSTAQSLGAQVNVQNANGDVDEQIAQIEYFIEKGMDVIVIIAIDSEALQDVVKKAMDKGIRVIGYDRLLVGSGADLYISFDNVRVGSLMGESLAENMPEGGNIFAIYGSRSDHNVAMVQEGLMDALEGTGIEIVYSAYCENWLAELAFGAVTEGLAQTTDIGGVMCGNDDLASQAIRALAERRLAGGVTVVAQDAELSACQRIVEGTQEMTVYKPVDELASSAAQLAVALGNGTDITGEDAPLPVTDTIFDGTEEIPYYGIEPVAVTRENIDEVIVDSGFHMREDVYLNVADKTEDETGLEE